MIEKEQNKEVVEKDTYTIKTLKKLRIMKKFDKSPLLGQGSIETKLQDKGVIWQNPKTPSDYQQSH